MKKIILEIHGQGMHLGSTGGLLLLRQQGKWRQFPFADVQISEHEIDKYPQIIHIPPGTYLCKKVDHSDIEQVWDWSSPFAAKKDIRLVIETELFMGNYHFSAPLLEQRCLISCPASQGMK